MTRPRRRIAAALAAACAIAPAVTQAEYLLRPGAVLQGLDKITARVSELEIVNGEAADFHGLKILVRACNVRPPEEPPEAAAFIEIQEGPGDNGPELFRGWMFASSPAVSAFEHPVYDVRVLRCLTP